MPLTKRRAMKEAATMLNGEARRAASILHQTPGWRWRRQLCLTERSQQRQSGPTTKAWRRLPARQRQTRVRHRQSTCEEQCQNWRETLASEATSDACEASSGHVHRALPELQGEGGACGWHRQARAGCSARTRSTRKWTALFQRTWQTTELQCQETCGQHRLEARRSLRQSECGWHRQTALSERVRVAPPGTTPGRVRIAPLKLDRPIVRVLLVHNDGA